MAKQSIIGCDTTGKRWHQLTDEEKSHVRDTFYARKMYPGEFKYRYHFNKNGKCEWAS